MKTPPDDTPGTPLRDPWHGRAPPTPPSPGEQALVSGIGCVGGLICAGLGLAASAYLLMGVGLMATGVTAGGWFLLLIPILPTAIGVTVGMKIVRATRRSDR